MAKKKNSSLIEELKKKFGSKTTPPSIRRIPTGVPPLDWMLGGGFPTRSIVSLWGPESSGKSTLALMAAANVQKGGGVVLWVDNELSFDPSYAAKFGLDYNGIVLLEGLTLEEIFQKLEEIAKVSSENEDVDFLFVLDSLAATSSLAEDTASYDQITVGAFSRALSQSLKKFFRSLADYHNLSILFITQRRDNVRQSRWGADTEIPYGGNALKHYSSLFLKFDKIRDERDTGFLHRRILVTKSKISGVPVFSRVDIILKANEGVHIPYTLLELGLSLGVFEQRRGWIAYGGKSMRKSEVLKMIEEDLNNERRILKEVEEKWKELHQPN